MMSENKKIPAEAIKHLESFGEGKSVPGSGCGCAFISMFDSQMILTHIKLSLNKSIFHLDERKVKQFNIWKLKIEEDFKQLNSLFDEDYILFEKYGELCRSTKIAKSKSSKLNKEKDSRQILTNSNDVLFKIASISIELGFKAISIFDEGYPDAKGESGLPIITLIGVAEGCKLVANLNFLKLPQNKRTENQLLKFQKIKAGIELLKREIDQRINNLDDLVSSKMQLNTLLDRTKSRSNHTYDDIERICREFQSILWNSNGSIEDEIDMGKILDILKPEKAIAFLDYKLIKKNYLGQLSNENGTFEVAGILDVNRKKVEITNKFVIQDQRFTLAHEIGHIVLEHHYGNTNLLHKDIPISKLAKNHKISSVEKEANRFASNYLMPRKLIRNYFKFLFNHYPFQINEESSFFMGIKDSSTFRKIAKNKFGLAKILSTKTRYGNESFKSLTEVFMVSPTVMAYRLMELELIDDFTIR